MAPKPRPWFRFYVETVHDRKIRRLKVEYRWLWVVVLAVARQSPRPGFLLVSEGDPCTAEDLADTAAMPVRTVQNGLKSLVAAGLLDRSSDVLRVVNWDARQFEGDNSTERSRRSRARSADRCDDDATLHDRSMQRPRSVTETETETEPVSTSTTTSSVATRTGRPVVDEQAVRACAVAVGRAIAAQDHPADPAAYAASVTRRILTGPDPTDRDRIRHDLADGLTPEAIAAGWAPPPVSHAPPPVDRPRCDDCNGTGMILGPDDDVARRCGCNPILRAVP